jgi:poly(hydroxyalkanoate) depolymerase family esterase
MTMDFARAMRAATKLTRAQKPMEATQVIQSALLLCREQPSKSATGQSVAVPDSEKRLIGLTPLISRFENAATGSLSDITAIGLDVPAQVMRRHTPPLPDGAQFLTRSYACADGSRSYKLYIPRCQRAVGRPLLVMLHGGTQDADDFAIGTRMNQIAEEYGAIVAYPCQSKAANSSLCWNWFRPEDQMRGRGEPAIIAGLTKDIIEEYDVDPTSVYVAGLSAGGAMAVVMGATYPEIFNAVGVHSGLPYKSAASVASAFAAMRGDFSRMRTGKHHKNSQPRLIVFHGDADRIVHPSSSTHLVQGRRKSGDSVERTHSQMSRGRRYSCVVTRDKTGSVVTEQWVVHGSGHAWSGGSSAGTYTDPGGPDASTAMMKFFLQE